MKALYLIIAALVGLSSVCAAGNPGKLEALAKNYRNLADRPLAVNLNPGDYKIRYDLKKNTAEIKLSRANFLLTSKAIELYDPTLLLESNNIRIILSRSF
jgi:hypothetical protein